MEQQPSYQWRWVMSGRKQLVTLDAAQVPGVEGMSRIWASFDGENGYAVYYHDRDQTIVQRVDVTPAEPISLVSHQRVSGALGWRPLHPNFPDTLNSLLRKRMDEAVSTEESINGDPCWKVSLGNVGPFVESGPDHEVVAWYSKRYSLLPRRIAILPVVAKSDDSTTVNLPPGSFPGFEDVLEYCQVKDELFKKSRWFPSKIQSRNLFSNELAVQTVLINATIPAETFVPEMPLGTEVLTMRAGSTIPLTHVVGGKDGERLYQERMQQFNNIKAVVADKQPVRIDASPQANGSLRKLFVVCSVLLIVVAIVAAKRQGRWF